MKIVEYKDVHLSFPARTPKLQLAVHFYHIANSHHNCGHRYYSDYSYNETEDYSHNEKGLRTSSMFAQQVRRRCGV